MASIFVAILRGYDHLIWSLDEENTCFFLLASAAPRLGGSSEASLDITPVTDPTLRRCPRRHPPRLLDEAVEERTSSCEFTCQFNEFWSPGLAPDGFIMFPRHVRKNRSCSIFQNTKFGHVRFSQIENRPCSIFQNRKSAMLDFPIENRPCSIFQSKICISPAKTAPPAPGNNGFKMKPSRSHIFEAVEAQKFY